MEFGVGLWQSRRRGKPGGPPRGTEALPCCERLEENPSPGLTCWGFLLWLFQGKIARWQPTPVVARANGRSFPCCNLHRLSTSNRKRIRIAGEHLTNPDACAANSLPVEVFWFEPMLERVSAGHTELLLHWRRTHRGPEQKA